MTRYLEEGGKLTSMIPRALFCSTQNDIPVYSGRMLIRAATPALQSITDYNQKTYMIMNKNKRNN